jgi:hypothetical protein
MVHGISPGWQIVHVNSIAVVLRYGDHLGGLVVFINLHHVGQRFFDVTVFIHLCL